MERDSKPHRRYDPLGVFQPTLSVWRETRLPPAAVCAYDFNPLSPCGERPRQRPAFSLLSKISTHSLRVERDGAPALYFCFHKYFNPLSPCGERLTASPETLGAFLFQPTLSVWRETLRPALRKSADRDFNPLSPCGERLYLSSVTVQSQSFQPTLSVWRETV